MSIGYTPDGATVRSFMRSASSVYGLQGLVVFGKSIGCIMDSPCLILG